MRGRWPKASASWWCSRAATPPARTGTIARIIQHLSPRATRVVALPKPSDREKSEWWFQRYVDQRCPRRANS